MATPTKSACTECAKAKRKCGRQSPACTRCETRGLGCVYLSRPTFWVVHPDSPSPAHPRTIESLIPLDSLDSLDVLALTKPSSITTAFLPNPTSISLPFEFSPPLSPLADTPLYQDQPWFLLPSTWTIHSVPHDELAPVSSMNASLRRTITEFRTMVLSWAATGSSPFIHSRLYKERLPRCVGDAFTSLAAYVMIRGANAGSSAAGLEMVLRVMGERIEQTVQDEDSREKGRTMDTFAHIARVHTLFILVSIGLFDGDIRLRHIAERHLPTLARWNNEMLEAAKLAAWNGELLLSDCLDAGGGGKGCGFGGVEEAGGGPRVSCSATKKTGVESLWQAFILSETVRRTWLVCSGVRGAYLLLQDGQLHCAGGLMFTTAEGFWDAPSAWEWTKLCAEKDVGFMEHAQTRRLFGERRPDEVDTFGKLMLVATWGAENMEIWEAQMNY
ncbi:hypothetical protein B0T14DRAFT_501307 [Immersiella caudata]|uniref:Zn(2)-C6 fungal-type domain-containing protein n=1 Tax=Immersiella caudata TaxID=314043 RepID=A0AA39XD67_9PEZI|nr:hypothetical protein B0T14DRAFT_501307 [Immersiella caudata]